MEFEWGITNGVFRKESELMLVDLNTVDGEVVNTSPGINFPLEVSKFPAMRMVQVNVLPRSNLRLAKAQAPVTNVELTHILLNLRRADGTWMLQDFPCHRLLAGRKGGDVRRELFFEPTVIDTRNSFVYVTQDLLGGPLPIEFVYV